MVILSYQPLEYTICFKVNIIIPLSYFTEKQGFLPGFILMSLIYML